MKLFLRFLRRSFTRRSSNIVVEDLPAGSRSSTDTILAGVVVDSDSSDTTVHNDNNVLVVSPAVVADDGTTITTGTHNSKAYNIAQNYLTGLNADTDMLRKTLSPTALFSIDGIEVLGSEFVDLHERVVKSFPDIRFSHELIEEVSPGIVMIKNVQASGTHTGSPFAFGPYEEINATGMFVRNDPEDMLLTIDMETESIPLIHVTAKGKSSGPQGFYEQIGGLII
jgi:hypothetical protein